MKKLILLSILSSIAFSEEPRFLCKDGVPDTLSMAKVFESLSEEQGEEFGRAYMALMFSRMEFVNLCANYAVNHNSNN